MNIVDVILLAVLAGFAIQGFIKGLIYEVASLAGLIIGIYASFHFSKSLGGYLVEYLDIPEKYSNAAAFILILILVVILVHFIGKIIENFVDLVGFQVKKRKNHFFINQLSMWRQCFGRDLNNTGRKKFLIKTCLILTDFKQL